MKNAHQQKTMPKKVRVLSIDTPKKEKKKKATTKKNKRKKEQATCTYCALHRRE
jgi:hypothetical protein